ncbi:hypothetical protein OROGR_000432 [Orobanche gracilis]
MVVGQADTSVGVEAPHDDAHIILDHNTGEVQVLVPKQYMMLPLSVWVPLGGRYVLVAAQLETLDNYQAWQ